MLSCLHVKLFMTRYVSKTLLASLHSVSQTSFYCFFIAKSEKPTSVKVTALFAPTRATEEGGGWSLTG